MAIATNQANPNPLESQLRLQAEKAFYSLHGIGVDQSQDVQNVAKTNTSQSMPSAGGKLSPKYWPELQYICVITDWRRYHRKSSGHGYKI